MFNKSKNLGVLSVLRLVTLASGMGMTQAYAFPIAPPSMPSGTVVHSSERLQAIRFLRN